MHSDYATPAKTAILILTPMPTMDLHNRSPVWHPEIMRWMGALLLLPLALAAQTKPEDPCSISGQVTNAATGEPVRRALVSLRRIDGSPGVTMTIQVGNTVTTDAAGRFAMTGIAPGKYRLSAERNGFLVAQYGARGPGKAGTLLTLEAGQNSSDLTMRMTPHGDRKSTRLNSSH